MKAKKKEARANPGEAACAAGRHFWIMGGTKKKPKQICGRCGTPRPS